MIGIKNYTPQVLLLSLTFFFVHDISTKAQQQDENRSAPVREIKSVDEFNRVLKDNRQPKVLKFFSPSCRHCIKVKRIVQDVAQQHPNVLFLEFSSNNARVNKLFDTYNVQAYPTFVFIDASGKTFTTHEGGYSHKELDDAIASLEKRAKKS